jgi:hypothetical protein
MTPLGSQEPTQSLLRRVLPLAAFCLLVLVGSSLIVAMTVSKYEHRAIAAETRDSLRKAAVLGLRDSIDKGYFTRRGERCCTLTLPDSSQQRVPMEDVMLAILAQSCRTSEKDPWWKHIELADLCAKLNGGARGTAP